MKYLNRILEDDIYEYLIVIYSDRRFQSRFLIENPPTQRNINT